LAGQIRHESACFGWRRKTNLAELAPILIAAAMSVLTPAAANPFTAIADMILISTQNTNLPMVLNEWLDALHMSRFRTDGALVLVLNKPALQPETDKLLLRMENLAMRLVMDFMPLLPATEETAWQPQSPENWDMLLGRPDTDESRNIDHWGLNE